MFLRLDAKLLSVCLLAAWQCGALQVAMNVSNAPQEVNLSCRVTTSNERIAVSWFYSSLEQSVQEREPLCYPNVWYRSDYARACGKMLTYLADDNTFVLKVPNRRYECHVNTWSWEIWLLIWKFEEHASGEVVLMSKDRNLRQPSQVTESRNIQPPTETTESTVPLHNTNNTTQPFQPMVLLFGGLLILAVAVICVCWCVVKKLRSRKYEESSPDQPEHLSDKEKQHAENVYDIPQGPKTCAAPVTKQDHCEYVEMISYAGRVDTNDYQVMGPNICKPAISERLNK